MISSVSSHIVPVERSSPQVMTMPGRLSDADLPAKQQRYYKTYREMRTDPTIAMVRMLAVAPLILTGWNYKETDIAPMGAKEFIKKYFEPLRIRLVKTAMEGYIDYGWAPYEMIKATDMYGYAYIKRLKPLLHHYTHILVDVNHGNFIGLRQEHDARPVDLSIYEGLLLTFDTEGTDYYGMPLMENARKAWEAGNIVDLASDRYDKKIAGTTIVVHYPVGTSHYNGTDTDNFEIARQILATMEASGKMIVPQKIQQFITETNEVVNEDAWKIELLTDSGTGRVQFIERAAYLDALKVRAFGFPERAILQGQHGTASEADKQADFAYMAIEVRHNLITQQINQQCVDFLLDLNWGSQAKGSVIIEPNPIADDKIGFYRDMYLALMKNPTIVADEINSVDMQQMRERLGLPRLMGVDSQVPIIPQPQQQQMPVPGTNLPPNLPTPQRLATANNMQNTATIPAQHTGPQNFNQN